MLFTLGKSVDWFGEFRDALKNPETSSPDVKKKYQMLIDFLDNTLIQTPPRKSPPPKPPISPIDAASSATYPRYQKLPSISDKAKSASKAAASEFETGTWDGMSEDKYLGQQGEKEGPGIRQYTIKEVSLWL